MAEKVYVVWKKNYQDPSKPWGQVWYGSPTNGEGKEQEYLGILQKIEVSPKDVDLPLSLLLFSYPCTFVGRHEDNSS